MLYTQLVRLWKGHMHVWEHQFHEQEKPLSVADRLINYTWSSIWKYLQIQTCLNRFHLKRKTEKIQFDITWYYVKRITRSSTIEGRIHVVTQLESAVRNLPNDLRAASAIRHRGVWTVGKISLLYLWETVSQRFLLHVNKGKKFEFSWEMNFIKNH